LSAPNSLPLPPDIVNPIVWDISSPSVASHQSPIKIYLKDPKSHPNRPRYPISLKHKWGLKPLIDKLLDKEILKPTHSPCNTPILPILKPNGSCRLVQDLRVVNLAVLPTHPVVPNPYTLFSHIPSDTFYFSVLDLKDAFFTIPLHLDCHNQFAFTWEDPASGLAHQKTFPRASGITPTSLARLWHGTYPLLNFNPVLCSNMLMISFFVAPPLPTLRTIPPYYSTF
jgi:hypothetical protein